MAPVLQRRLRFTHRHARHLERVAAGAELAAQVDGVIKQLARGAQVQGAELAERLDRMARELGEELHLRVELRVQGGRSGEGLHGCP
nr:MULTISPECIES: hypothetical protein [unclassified Massilia]